MWGEHRHRFHTSATKLNELSGAVRDELHTEVEKHELSAFTQVTPITCHKHVRKMHGL